MSLVTPSISKEFEKKEMRQEMVMPLIRKRLISSKWQERKLTQTHIFQHFLFLLSHFFPSQRLGNNWINPSPYVLYDHKSWVKKLPNLLIGTVNLPSATQSKKKQKVAGNCIIFLCFISFKISAIWILFSVNRHIFMEYLLYAMDRFGFTHILNMPIIWFLTKTPFLFCLQV